MLNIQSLDLPDLKFLAGSCCLVTGARGLLGTALVELIRAAEPSAEILTPTRSELDLQDKHGTADYFRNHRPEYVFHMAATVFGLAGNMANQMKSLSENTVINDNLLSALVVAQPRYVFFASTVAGYGFPYSSLPLVESEYFIGEPHRGEYGYACAKRHAFGYLRLLRKELNIDTTYGILTNLYGENDRFDEVSGHVIPSLMVKALKAAETGSSLSVWGDGTATRDFLHATDAARAILYCASSPAKTEILNISSGVAVSIGEVASIIANCAGLPGLTLEPDKPVGIATRVVDNSRLKSIGFVQNVLPSVGVPSTFEWLLKHREGMRN
jgi:GDP-L-fucose synthase